MIHREAVVAAAASAAIAVLLAAGCGPKLSATSEVLEHDVAVLERLIVLVDTPQLDALTDWWRHNRNATQILSEEFAGGFSGALEARLMQALSASGADVRAASSADLDLEQGVGKQVIRDFEPRAILVVREETVLIDDMRCTGVVLTAELQENRRDVTRPVIWRARAVLDPHAPEAAIRLTDVAEFAAAAVLDRFRADGLADLLPNPEGYGLQPN